jgi:hypothetical protein
MPQLLRIVLILLPVFATSLRAQSDPEQNQTSFPKLGALASSGLHNAGEIEEGRYASNTFSLSPGIYVEFGSDESHFLNFRLMARYSLNTYRLKEPYQACAAGWLEPASKIEKAYLDIGVQVLVNWYSLKGFNFYNLLSFDYAILVADREFRTSGPYTNSGFFETLYSLSYGLGFSYNFPKNLDFFMQVERRYFIGIGQGNRLQVDRNKPPVNLTLGLSFQLTKSDK